MNKLTIKLIRALVEPHELPHHDDVRRVEQQLQNAGNRQGDGEPDDLPQQRAMGHVNFIGATAAFQFR